MLIELFKGVPPPQSPLPTASAMGESGDTQTLAPLVAAIKDESVSVRGAAAAALGRIGDRQAVAALVGALKDEDWFVKGSAAKVLQQLGWEPDDEAQKALCAVSQCAWREAILLGKAAVEPLLERLEDRPWEFSGIVQALGEIGDRRAVAPLARTLEDTDNKIRSIVHSLNSEFAPHDVRELRKAVIEALGKIGDVLAVAPLVGVLRDGYEGMRRTAAEALARIGTAAVDELILALSEPDIEVRLAAAQILGKIRDARAIDTLVVSLMDEDFRIRRAAAEALGSLGWEPRDDAERAFFAVAQEEWEEVHRLGPAAIEALTNAVKWPETSGGINWEMREAAVTALRRIGGRRAITALVIAQIDMGRSGSAAEKALEGIDPRWMDTGEARSAVPELLDALQAHSGDFRKRTAGILGKIGDPRSFGPLLELTSDPATGVSFRQACIAERNLPGVRLGGKRSPVLPVVAP